MFLPPTLQRAVLSQHNTKTISYLKDMNNLTYILKDYAILHHRIYRKLIDEFGFTGF